MTVKVGDMVQVDPLYLEFIDNRSRKFWEIFWVDNTTWKTCYGRIGCMGSQSQKEFSDKRSAQREFDKIVHKKRNKGYNVANRPPARREFDLEMCGADDYFLVTALDQYGYEATCLNSEGKRVKFDTSKLSVPWKHEVGN